MAQTETAPTTGIDPKQTAANIVKGVTAKATGISPKGPEAPADGDEKGAIAADPNAGKRKFSVEGREVWLTPDQADAYVQKGIAFEPRISELARIKQEVIQFEQAMLNNPGGVLSALAKRANIPVQSMVEKVLQGTASDEVKEATGRWYWENVAKRHQMDPKDLQILEQEEKIKAYEESKKSETESAIARENQQKVARALGEVSAQISETLKELGIKNVDSQAGIRITRTIADVMRISYQNKQPLTAKQACEKVKAVILDQQREFYDDLDDDQLVEYLGKANAEKVRKHFLKKMKDQESGTKQEAQHQEKFKKRDERKTINLDEFHDRLAELKAKSK